MNQKQQFLKKHINLILTSGGNLLQRSLLRTVILILSLSAILFPFIAAHSISEGIKLQSKISVEEGADFYVSGDAGGSSTPLMLSIIDRFRKISGVDRVMPRIVGRAYVRDRTVSIVGLPGGILPDSLIIREGRGILKKGEVVVGSTLSDRCGLITGSSFYMPINRWQRFTVAGVFSSGCSIWSSNLIYMSMEDAQKLFRMQGVVTDFLVYAKPGQEAVVSVYLQMENRKDPPLRIQSKELVNRYMQRGFESRAGIFTAFYLTAFALALPIVLILTGLGSSERRREIGTLKAVGWQTLDVMEVVLWENIFVSIISACLTLLTAFMWIRLFNGFFIAQFFISEPGIIPAFPVPARFIPVPVLLSFLLAFVLTMTGSLYSTWRMSVTPAAETMR